MTIIFSVYSQDRSIHQNRLLHTATINELTAYGITYKEVQGRFKGMNEVSLVVPDRAENLASEFCRRYEQSCYLKINSEHHNEAWEVSTLSNLRFPPDERYVGRFKSVCRWLAERYDSYTYDPVTKTYYTIVP